MGHSDGVSVAGTVVARCGPESPSGGFEFGGARREQARLDQIRPADGCGREQPRSAGLRNAGGVCQNARVLARKRSKGSG